MKLLKKTLCFMLATILITLQVSVPVYAASSSTSISGSVSTGTATGGLTKTSSSAIATTSFNWGGGTRTVTATVYYSYGTLACSTKATNSSTQSGGVSVTATKLQSSGIVVGAMGWHQVRYNSYVWTGTTRLGIIYADAVDYTSE